MYDLLSMGRSGMDLYAEQVGAPFEAIRSFSAYVGGSPANIAVGAQRLGLRSVLLTAVGADPVGDFILHGLRREGVETRFIPRKPGTRSGAVLLGLQPPDRFPLVHYRANAADLQLDIDDVLAAPLAETRLFLFVGTNLSGTPSRDATLFAAERARGHGAEVVLDLDFRADQWSDPRAFGVAIRSSLRLVDVAIGTQEEIKAAVLTEAGGVHVAHGQFSEARVQGDLEAAVEEILALGPRLLIEKRGAAGVRLHAREGTRTDVPGFPIEVQNTLGAGDAFAAGFLYGHARGWDLYRSARLGNACGALLVTRHGCSASCPTLDEAMALVDEHGGWYGTPAETLKTIPDNP
jgi:5-dehydro-2-deoxygluconokinase